MAFMDRDDCMVAVCLPVPQHKRKSCPLSRGFCFLQWGTADSWDLPWEAQGLINPLSIQSESRKVLRAENISIFCFQLHWHNLLLPCVLSSICFSHFCVIAFMWIYIHILIQWVQIWGKSHGLPHPLGLAHTMVQSLGCNVWGGNTGTHCCVSRANQWSIHRTKPDLVLSPM